MPRFTSYLLLLLAAPAVAAPVPKLVLSAEQEREFDDLWDGADGRRSAFFRQFCRLVSQPDAAIAYITKTVMPAKLTEEEAKQLIADLDSKDESVWRAAWRDIRNRDVRLALTFSEAWRMAKTERQQLRLGLALHGYNPLSVDQDDMTFELEKPRRKGEKLRASIMSGKGNSIRGGWTPEVFETFDELAADRKKNKRSCDGNSLSTCYALERIGTAAARKLLETLTEGHPDACITTQATAALERMKTPVAGPKVEFDKVWKLDLYKFIDTDTPNAFLDRPKEAVEFFHKNLRPVKLTANTAKELLARLLSDDKKEVRAAFHELQVVDLALELDLMEEFEKLKTPAHRCRLAAAMYLWSDVPYGDITDEFDIDERMKEYDYTVGTSLTAKTGRNVLWKEWRDKAPGGVRRDDPRDNHRTLCRSKEEIHRDRWYHEESAIHILDAIGTDDAVAIIKDMATGHPDAGPTKAAKDVLKRRGAK